MDKETDVKAAKKRSKSENADPSAPTNKKLRLGFSGKKFRNQLKTDQRTEALQEFLHLVNEEPKQECIAAYLENGGSVLEILQLIESDSTLSPVLIFEIANYMLLQINAKYPQYQNSASEACRYLLNTYITLINKMLSLSSSSKERLIVLKLLTTIVTFSGVLAKDILLHVNFNPTNLELLTKVTEKNEVRSAFIHFIMAFLVEGHFPTLSVLLEKKGFMTSIIKGLQYDKVDIVVLVMTVMKDRILENTSVSKTVKMKTFSTPVVKDIVNLYNWKGPGGIVDQKKKNKVATVDEIDKSKVNKAVHSFLLVLCTSHRFGVIFKDHNMGLSNKHQNSLMFTVLGSLERPWEHSYAGELVIKMCKACPDLTKTLWTNMKPFLEPRWTNKWLNTMKFATQLLDGLEPDCMEFCVNNLNVHQVFQVITTLIVPSTIIQIVIPESQTYEKSAIKHQVLLLLLRMIRSVQNYVAKSKFWKIDHEFLNNALANHINRNFPDVRFVLNDWDQSDEDLAISDYLEMALDLLEQFRNLAPKMLGEIFDIKEFLTKTETVVEASHLRKLQVKAVKLFMDLEPTLFSPKNELFDFCVGFSLEFYYASKDSNALYVLHNILEKSGVFDGFLTEIDLWIDGVLNLKNYDCDVANFLCDLIKKTDLNIAEYNRRLFQFKNSNFSPLILALNVNDVSKSTKTYLNFVILNLFHLQVDTSAFTDVTSQLPFLSDDFLSYIRNWDNLEVVTLNKCKGILLERFRKFSADFLEGYLEFSNLDLYSNLKLNLLQTIIFYLNNLIKAEALKENHVENCQNFVEFLLSENAFEDGRFMRIILGNPTILHNFTLFDSNDITTKLILEIVRNRKVEDYLIAFRHKIFSIISKIFKKPRKYYEITICIEIVETFGLDYAQCSKLIEKFVSLEDNKCFYRVASYCLDRMATLAKNDLSLPPLSNNVIKELSLLFCSLIKDQISNLNHFSGTFLSYLKVFPHNLQDVEVELFDSLITMTEFHKDNLSLCEFLLDRRNDFISSFQENLDGICSKKGFLLTLLRVVVKQNNDELLETIFNKFENQIMKALQKPHKAGQHFQNNYKSVGILVEKFLKPEKFGTQVQKFESTELFHVYLLKIIYSKVELTEKTLGNIIMTFIHLLVNLLKQKSGSKSVDNLVEICQVVENFLSETKTADFDVTFLTSNETFKTFCKSCLKFGVSGDVILLKILSKLVELCFLEDDAKLVLEMLLSHSKFLDVVLSDFPKTEVLHLWQILCKKWPQFMERSHVPVLLSSYRATRSESDKILLDLLKMYEGKPDQTHFYDFKPFLWGRAAASHYSVRSDIQKVLWRQPKMADVLDNLHQPTVMATITDPSSPHSYDLEYFLPLFSHLLAPENPVQTYRFTKSGALALTVTGLRDKSLNLAACHVLSRFYFHQEARQVGKDNLLWLRFVEAICKGTAVLDDLNMTNFVGVFLARMALILTQPTDVMYVPLTQYLGAKDALDFSTVPELYTFLHSSHVDFKEHKHFILEVLRDGLRTEKDLTTLLRSMGFKLISELCSSGVCDLATKLLILDVFKNCCRVPLGVKVLCGNLSFLTQVFALFTDVRKKKERDTGVIMSKLLEILHEIVQMDGNRQRNFLIYLNLMMISEDDQCFSYLAASKGLDFYYQILVVIADRFPDFLSRQNMDNFLRQSGDQFCNYLVKYGCRFVRETDFSSNVSPNYLRILFYNKLK